MIKTLVLFLGLITVTAQVRPPADTIRPQLEDFATKKAEELASRLGTSLGTLGAEADAAVRRWDVAVREWKRERSKEGAPLLAEGVLFDCLSRMVGVKTRVLSSERASPYFSDLAATRPKRAAKAFDEALQIDPTLTEAEFRLARIRAPSSIEDRLRLERLANQEQAPFAYLASISLGEVALRANDAALAERWYLRATEQQSTSTAAAIGMAASSGRPVDFSRLGRPDIYYQYPCIILTSSVSLELERRVARQK